MTITRYPLCWPNNVARTAPQRRTYPQFNTGSISSAVQKAISEINRLNGRRWDYDDQSVILSSNLRLKKNEWPVGDQGQPVDTGIAIYFTLRFARTGKWHERPCVLTCDKWSKVQWNIDAIARDIEAQRARQRYGCTSVEQAFAGYVAIPEKCGGSPWWIVLDVPSTAGVKAITDAFREKAMDAHPDKGGDLDKWHQLQEAHRQAMASAEGQP